MRKDFVTEDEWEGSDELDVYERPLGISDTLDADDYGLTGAEEAFMLGYLST